MSLFFTSRPEGPVRARPTSRRSSGCSGSPRLLVDRSPLGWTVVAGERVLPPADARESTMPSGLSSSFATGAAVHRYIYIVAQPRITGNCGPRDRRVPRHLGILSADGGRLTAEQVGSNEDLPSFDTVPLDLGEDFQNRYGDAAGAIGNMNVSPHLPNAAQMWLAAWEENTDEKLDGVLAADVVALGALVAAGGGVVPMPAGGTLAGSELAAFATRGSMSSSPTMRSRPRERRTRRPSRRPPMRWRSRCRWRTPKPPSQKPSRMPSPSVGSWRGLPTRNSRAASSRRSSAARWPSCTGRRHVGSPQHLGLQAGHLPGTLPALPRGPVRG